MKKEKVENNGERTVTPLHVSRAIAAKVAVARLRSLDAKLCPCGRLVLRGLDDDLMGMTVEVDPMALSAVGEVVALRDGRTTYTVEHNRLYVRYADRMRKYRHHDFEVLAQHRCGSPIDTQFGRTEITIPKARKAVPDEPEY